LLKETTGAFDGASKNEPQRKVNIVSPYFNVAFSVFFPILILIKKLSEY